MRKMSKNIREIEEAKKAYIKALLRDWCDKYQKGENYSINGMKELIRLTEISGPGTLIPKAGWAEEIRWGVERWWRYSTGVLDGKTDSDGHVSYCIKKEFYEPIKRALIEYEEEHASAVDDI